jgi:hypothetical protein
MGAVKKFTAPKPYSSQTYSLFYYLLAFKYYLMWKKIMKEIG